MAATESTRGVTPRDREIGDEVTIRLFGDLESARIVEDAGVDARYGRGPEQRWVVEVVGAGKWRVPESDIVAPR